ncbi:hypothetical protein Scep_015822 [Stephania cephalantha]|uniref:Uncharacterized protein n=1 Tax=Stephania cephalantha TaxID=152367 RepID=A0AAP0J6A5_9MAGN
MKTLRQFERLSRSNFKAFSSELSLDSISCVSSINLTQSFNTSTRQSVHDGSSCRLTEETSSATLDM